MVPAFALAQVAMSFGGGAGLVTIPGHYQKVEDNDASLVVESRPEGNVRLYLDLHKLDAATRVENPGEQLVEEQAEKKGRKTRRRGDKVAFFDPGPPTVVNGRTMLYLHWQIGWGKTLVVFSAHAPQDAKDAADVKRFLGGDIELIIDSLRRVDG